jgi:hypothetical protein
MRTLVLLVTLVLVGCGSWSAHRRADVDSCLKSCRPTTPNERQLMGKDPRTDCERRCYER